jgi:hypothetical protein
LLVATIALQIIFNVVTIGVFLYLFWNWNSWSIGKSLFLDGFTGLFYLFWLVDADGSLNYLIIFIGNGRYGIELKQELLLYYWVRL